MRDLTIRRFAPADQPEAIRLFREFMADLHGDFREYIERAVRDELSRISDYYSGAGQAFWVAEQDGIVGMAGVERHSAAEGELRRMIVDRRHRRRGIARALLSTAEAFCRGAGYAKVVLNTTQLQPEARRLYESAGYLVFKVEKSIVMTHKSAGGGLERYYYEKTL